MVERISVNVEEVKRKHSAILAAPQSDDSEYHSLYVSFCFHLFICGLFIHCCLLKRYRLI